MLAVGAPIDTKQSQIVFSESGLALRTPAFDLGIAGQLLDPAGAHSVSALAQRELGRKVASWEDLAGRGAKAQPIRELAVEDVANWAAQQVCALRSLQGVHSQIASKTTALRLSATRSSCH